jgi:Transmembrane protein 43
MMRAAWLAATACLSLLAGGVFAEGAPLGAPQPDRTVRDPEFGVRARHLGLERRVTMLQWQRGPTGYTRVWSEALVDSSASDPAHRNPTAFPLNSRRWLARTVTIDGKPLDPAVLPALGIWRDFRPSFNALPANLAATFQPEGDGLGSADNPLDPQVGDLRIQWRDLELPPLDDRLVLRDGRWQLSPAASSADTASAADPSVVPLAPAPVRWPWLAGGLLLALVAVGIWWKRRASSRSPR